MIEKIYKNRYHTTNFNQNVPDKKLVKILLKKTYELVPSKQSILPYKIDVLGPDQANERKTLVKFCESETALSYGHKIDNSVGVDCIKSPYILVFTTRKINDLSESMKDSYKRNSWCWPVIDNANQVVDSQLIEIGMFSTILTGLCLEKKMCVSYSMLFPQRDYHKWKDIDFITGKVIFMMGLGHSDMEKPIDKVASGYERKPPIENIIRYIST